MLYIDEDQNITLTRGDTGIFNISLQSQDGQAYATLFDVNTNYRIIN